MEKETRIGYWAAVLVVLGLTALFQTLFMHRTFNHVYGIEEEGRQKESELEGNNAAIQLMQVQHYLDKK